MSTQAMKVSLISSRGEMALEYTATLTDDAGYAELVDSVNGLSLYKTMKGMSIDRFIGSYAGGCGSFRIRNTNNNTIKAIEAVPKAGGEYVDRLFKPVTIQDNDVIEGKVTAEAS